MGGGHGWRAGGGAVGHALDTDAKRQGCIQGEPVGTQMVTVTEVCVGRGGPAKTAAGILVFDGDWGFAAGEGAEVSSGVAEVGVGAHGSQHAGGS